MSTTRRAALVLAAAAAAAACGRGIDEPEPGLAVDVALLSSFSPLGAPPPDPTNAHADSPGAVALGHALFFDAGLSPDGRFSCADCHRAELGLADGRSLGEGRATLPRHVPTLWNVGWQRWFFWDGRADTLWGQAVGPIENPLEMASDRLHVAHHVHGSPRLRASYEAEFGPLPALHDRSRFPARGRPGAEDARHAAAWDAMSEADRDAVNVVAASVGKALAAYQRRLASGEAPFDRFVAAVVAGDRDRARDALPASARRGLELFVGRARCVLCHAGPAFTDREFHDTRVPPLGGGTPTDSGRFGGIAALAVSTFGAGGPHDDDADGARALLSRGVRAEGRTWGEFKTPGLRNVALSPPYMHQGQLATLADVVRYYSTLEGALPLGHHQETLLVPAELSEAEQADLVAFLESLTGEGPDPAFLAAPRR